MKKYKVGDVIKQTKVFSITPYSSVGTIKEFREFTTNVCDFADSLDNGRISLDVRKDDHGRVLQVDFIVEGGKVCDETEANFYNDMAKQDAITQRVKDVQLLQEIHDRNPELFGKDPKFLEY